MGCSYVFHKILNFLCFNNSPNLIHSRIWNVIQQDKPPYTKSLNLSTMMDAVYVFGQRYVKTVRYNRTEAIQGYSILHCIIITSWCEAIQRI